MDIAYDVRPLDAEVEDAYRRLLPEQIDLVEQGKLAWKFLRHPAAKGAVATAELDGAIVGMIGFAPHRLKLAGRRVIAHQAMDTVVDPVCRGKGVFVKLGRAFYDAAPRIGSAAAFGFPNENAAPGWFGKLDWTRLGTPPFLVKPLNAGYFARRAVGGAGALFDALPLSLIGRPADADRAVRVERFDARADALWEAFSASIPAAVDRTHDFLNWRLFDHPTATYETRAVFDGDVMRAFVTTHLADKHGGRIGYIMEAMALPGAEADLVMLLKLAIAGMREKKTDAVLAWAASHAPNAGAYRKAGFIPMPDRIRPIHLYFGGKPLAPEAEPGFGGEQDWYLSYLDSDTV
jgi:GNAT superfamily N-acetyltransferase